MEGRQGEKDEAGWHQHDDGHEHAQLTSLSASLLTTSSVAAENDGSLQLWDFGQNEDERSAAVGLAGLPHTHTQRLRYT